MTGFRSSRFARGVFALLAAVSLGGSAVAQSRTPVSLAPAGETAAALSAQSPSAAQLRLIQTQLKRVIKQVMPATVGVEVRGAAGSGVIVNKEGLVLTAGHVVGQAGRRAWVELPDGRRLEGRTLGANHDIDAGMIKLNDPPLDLPFAPASDGPGLANGQWVVTIGQPG